MITNQNFLAFLTYLVVNIITMTLLNENFNKELQRMAKLAGVKNNPLNENTTQTSENTVKEEVENIEVVEENKVILTEMPLFGDDEEEETFSTPDKPTGDLDKNLKAAMVLNNVSQYEAVLLDLYTNYNPLTKGAKPESEGGEKGTVYTKRPIQKLPGASSEINRLSKFGDELTPDEVQKLNAAGVSDEEISAAIELQRKTGLPKRRMPLSFGETPGLEGAKIKNSLAKWQPTRKNASIISYTNNTLSNTGKQQLEFLSRMLSKNPLNPNGDENVDIEQSLLDTIYTNVVVENAEFIIRDFFNKALIPVLSSKLKRNNTSPKDAQFDILKTAGIDKAIDMTKSGQYNASGEYQNYGAWFMTVATNKAIDELKSISDYKFDRENVTKMLQAHNGPFRIESKLHPDKAFGNYNLDVLKSQNTYTTKDGETKPYFIYVYDDAESAIPDFEAGYEKTNEGNKFSPLGSKFLKNKSQFYTSTLKGTPDDLSQTVTQPTFDEKINIVPINDVLKFAAKKVQDVLSNIAGQMTLDSYNSKGQVPEGEEVRISRKIEDYPTFTKGQYYKVVGKEKLPPPTGGPEKNYYKLLDNNGDEKLVEAYNTTAKKAIDTKVVSKLRDTKDATVEILRQLLQYGSMRLVYTSTVYYPSPEGGWTKKDVGSTVLKDKSGKIVLPWASKNLKDRYVDLESVPMRWEWASLKKNVDNVNEDLIDSISKIANERGFKLPSAYFDDNNNPLYKMRGAPSDMKQKTMSYLNAIKNNLEKYFGVEGGEIPAIKKNRDELNTLINNYTQSVQARDKGLAENHIRKAVREMIAKKLSK